ncbi:HAD family hydrolase [Rhodobacterales bacterium]|nr:HAD family hydrolase [Rhodobacterales bacterium]
MAGLIGGNRKTGKGRSVKDAIKAILFDKDGTLLDFAATFAPAYRQAADLATRGDPELARHLLTGTGMDIETEMAAAGSLLAAGNSEEIAAAWIALGADGPRDTLSAELDHIFTQAMHAATALPGVPAAVKALRDMGYTLGVASSDSEAAIRAFLSGKSLTDTFSFVCGYDSGHGPKPEPGMLLAFARDIGLPPSRIAMIGDNTHDLEMARAAGAGLAIGVLSGTSNRDDLAVLADDVLQDAAELVSYFAESPA